MLIIHFQIERNIIIQKFRMKRLKNIKDYLVELIGVMLWHNTLVRNNRKFNIKIILIEMERVENKLHRM